MALELALIVAALVSCMLVLLVLFEPGLSYRIDAPVPAPDSREFLRLVGAITDSDVHDASSVDVLTNGTTFYDAELHAIRAARRTVHIVAFIFHPSAIGDRFLAALTERARAGVRVRVIVDAIGSFPTPDRYFADLRTAGGEVALDSRPHDGFFDFSQAPVVSHGLVVTRGSGHRVLTLGGRSGRRARDCPRSRRRSRGRGRGRRSPA